jgi:hypothetical protein
MVGLYYETGHQEQAKPYFLDALTIFEAQHSPNAAVVRGWLENYREKR